MGVRTAETMTGVVLSDTGFPGSSSGRENSRRGGELLGGERVLRYSGGRGASAPPREPFILFVSGGAKRAVLGYWLHVPSGCPCESMSVSSFPPRMKSRMW